MSDTEQYAEATLPTEYGTFRVLVFREPTPEGADPVEHVALVRGDVRGASDVLARLHSECLTGEVFHSLKCDCREQLALALERIAEADRGVLVYLRQEGRGIGLGNKIRAYALQDKGLDTVDANRALGFEDDLRGYEVAAQILRELGVTSVALMTNNPEKQSALRDAGIEVTRRVTHEVMPHAINRDYLATKRARMGHALQGEMSAGPRPDRVDSDGKSPNGSEAAE